MQLPSKPPRDAARAPAPRRVRPAVEPLEERCLMASGVLDSAFNPNAVAPLSPGLQTLNFSAASMERANAVAVQADGKILAAGVFTPDPNRAAREFGVARFNADGSLDTSFGDGGRTAVGFGGFNAEARAMALQSDGKIVLAGSVNFGPGNDDFALARLNADGSLDASFDSDGVRVLAIDGFLGMPGHDRLNAVAVQTDGKIVAAGAVQMDNLGDSDFAVVRFNANGSLDRTFAASSPTPGVQRIAMNLGEQGFQGDEAFGLAVQAVDESVGMTGQGPTTEKIVVAGTAQTGGGTSAFAVARLNADGALDPNFNGTGTTAFNFNKNNADSAAAVAVQLDGKILVAGTTMAAPGDFDMAVARLNYDGSLDARFDKDGLQTVSFNRGGGYTDVGLSVAVRQGRAVVAGVSFDGRGNSDAAVARLRSDGTLDTSFGEAGKRTIAFDQGGSNADGANAVAIQDDGKIVLAGFSANSAGNDDFALARLGGEGRAATQGIFDPVNGMWFLRDSMTAGAPTVTPFAYGGVDWIPVVGDWDGNGTFTVGVYDPFTATFCLRNSNTSGAPDAGVFVLGQANAGWIPVAGDWDGDGVWTVGIFDPTTATWHIKNSNTEGDADATFRYGGQGVKPVVGDWDGDGRYGIGIYDSTGRWFLRNSVSAGSPDVQPFFYGSGQDKPVVGDWDGDGVTTVGVFNMHAQWQLRNSNDPGNPDVKVFAYGGARVRPLSGVWVPPPLTLTADGGEYVAGPQAPGVHEAVVAAMAVEALDRLRQEGLSAAQLTLLNSVKVQTSPLPAGTLSSYDANENRLVLDDNGAGHGWHVDATPQADEEYLGSSGVAVPGTQASGRMDLLSAILRQMRRVLDRLEGDAGVKASEKLAAGVRRL